MPNKVDRNMSADYKSLLLLIVRLAKQQKGDKHVSLAYLTKQTSIPVEELSSIIHLLEKEGYIATKQPSAKVTLLQPTISGYEKAKEWDELAQTKTLKMKILTFGKLVGASLLAVILGIVWWWIGLSPETSDITPLGATVPLRLYQKNIQPPNYYVPGGWYDFPNAPKNGTVVSAKNFEETNKLLSTIMTEYTPVTFDGYVVITFDIESIAPSYQVNIDEVQIAINRKPLEDPKNLYYEPPHLGAGDMREFELTLSPNSLLSNENGVELYQTHLKSNGQDVDYIYLRPGERETFEVSVKLDKPGSYILTPVIKYSFRNKQATLQANPYTMIYPERYQAWYWDGEMMSCQGNNCTGGGGKLVVSPIILDTQSTNIVIEQPTKIKGVPACYPERKWIAFESSMVTFGYMDRVFLIDTMGDRLRPVSKTDLHNTRRKLAWLDDGNLLVGDPTSWDESNREYIYTNFVLNPLTLEKLFQQEEGNAAILWSNYSEKTKTCFNDKSGCFKQKADRDTNGYNGIDTQDLQHLFVVREDAETPFAYISDQSQTEPVISPNNNWIAFIDRKEIKNNYGNISYVEGISLGSKDGTVQRKIKNFDGWYENLNWSPDGEFLLYSSYRPINGIGELGSDSASANYHVYILSLETGVERTLTSYDSQGSYFEWDFSQDGKWVVIGGNRITIAAIDDSCSQEIFVPPFYYGWINISNILLQP